MAAAPAPDGRHDDLGQDELAGLELLIPDDARSLDGDRAQLLRELRQGRDGRSRRTVGATPVDPRRLGRPPGFLGRLIGSKLAAVAVPSSVVVVGILISALFITTMVFLAPQLAPGGLDPLPLATAGAAPSGQVGGLLPDVSLDISGLTVSAQAVRPGVLVEVAASCSNCQAVLSNLYAQVRLHRLQLALVGGAAQQVQLAKLAVDDFQTVTVAIDRSGVLAQDFPPSGVTAILVHADGIVAGVVTDLQADQSLSPQLSTLSGPGARTGP
jgi:hypothetical protein